MAVGIALPEDPRQLAYLCASAQSPGRYYLELEAAGSSADPTDYRVIARLESIEYDELLPAVARHLGVEPTAARCKPAY
ncbi:MAG: hypothetical protein ACJAQZ_004996 [Planctomycetota bacterium]|jgi:hypothetical protein